MQQGRNSSGGQGVPDRAAEEQATTRGRKMVRKAFQGRIFLRDCCRFSPGTAYIVVLQEDSCFLKRTPCSFDSGFSAPDSYECPLGPCTKDTSKRKVGRARHGLESKWVLAHILAKRSDAPGDPEMTPASLPIDLRGSVDIIDDIGGPYGPPRPFHCGPLAAAPLVSMMHHRHKSVR